MKDSLYSIDLFRCESVALRTYWVLAVMDQYTRRIIGFGIHVGIVDGRALCPLFPPAIRRQTIPKYLSSDHDPLYRFHQWQANLRVLGITEIKTVPYVPLSHPFVERLIGTIRREYLDRTLFWTAVDLESKLLEFKDYYNRHRTHASLAGKTPEEAPGVNVSARAISAASLAFINTFGRSFDLCRWSAVMEVPVFSAIFRKVWPANNSLSIMSRLT